MSEISKQALAVENSTNFPNNNTGYITPSLLRSFNTDMIDSTVNQIVYTADSASWNDQITALEAFSGSQQPSFTALNAFTASQLTKNTGYNSATQSLSASIASTNVNVAQLQSWSGSVNQIIASNVSLGYATRFNFSGFITASLTSNVNGTIADISVTSDSTKTNTSSFNSYTASTNTQINSMSSSFSSSIYQLNQYTASEESQVNPFTASVNAFTASTIIALNNINSFTASANQRLTAIESVSGSWITESETGSFAFLSKNQNFTGNNTFIGDTAFSASNTFGTASFFAPVFIYNGVSSNLTLKGNTTLTNQADLFLGGDPYTVYNGIGLTQNSGDYAIIGYGTNSSILNFGAVDSNTFSYSTELLATATPTKITFQDFSFGDYQYNTWLTLLANNGSNPAPIFNRGIVSSGSFNASGSVTITGSAYGNIVPLSIASETASIDLSKGNFFTLSLVSGSTTHLTATNIKQGQTINLLVSQPANATGSVSYNSAIKFPAGNNYIATPTSGSKDIITFITFDNSTIYASAINNLV